MTKIRINTINKYYVHLEKNSDNLTNILADYQNRKFLIISDENVWREQGENLIKSFKDNSFEYDKVVLKPGEETKSLETCNRIYYELSKRNMTRSDILVAFGGGVVGDLTGFVASTYLRGIKFIQIPTSLLAQADSSIGGKVGVNLPQGKNLVGSFYNPEFVYINTAFLNSLDEKEWNNGMAEIIKAGLIKDKYLFEQIDKLNKNELMENILELLYLALEVKRKLVEEDFRDTGSRMLLNFGHTFGHAFEKQANFKNLRHGEAVGLGMIVALLIGEQRNFHSKEIREKLTKNLFKIGLPINYKKYLNKETFDILLKDKKIINGFLNMILLKDIGNSVIEKIALDDIGEVKKCLL